MNFELSQEQLLVRDTFRRFSDEKIKPVAAALDEAHELPSEIIVGRLDVIHGVSHSHAKETRRR